MQISRANDPEGDFPFEGKVDFVDTEVDAGTGTIRVRGVIPNAEKKLFPGLFVRIRVPVRRAGGRRARASATPSAARSPATREMVERRRQGRAADRRSSGPRKTARWSSCREGLAAGDRYIIRGLQKAKAGDEVNPLTEEEMERKLVGFGFDRRREAARLIALLLLVGCVWTHHGGAASNGARGFARPRRCRVRKRSPSHAVPPRGPRCVQTHPTAEIADLPRPTCSPDSSSSAPSSRPSSRCSPWSAASWPCRCCPSSSTPRSRRRRCRSRSATPGPTRSPSPKR